MKLIVGLGNPGKEYETTRHNVGFMVIDNYLNNDTFKIKFNGMYLKKNINNQEVIFLKPLSYMNLSGEVVKKYGDYFKINIEDILIISDDLDMPCFKIKLKYKGSSGGHNGLKNISQNLHTEEFKRLKIGISNDKNIDTKSYVLGSFSKEELEALHRKFEITNNIINDFVSLDFEKVMSKYNE